MSVGFCLDNVFDGKLACSTTHSKRQHIFNLSTKFVKASLSYKNKTALADTGTYLVKSTESEDCPGRHSSPLSASTDGPCCLRMETWKASRGKGGEGAVVMIGTSYRETTSSRRSAFSRKDEEDGRNSKYRGYLY